MKYFFAIVLAVLSCSCQSSSQPPFHGPFSEPLHFKINSINKLQQEHHSGLKNYLAASPYWSLRRTEKGRIAVRRPLWQGKLYATADDRFVVGKNEQHRGHVELRLDTNAVIAQQPAHVTRVHGSVKNVKLRLRPTQNETFYESVFMVAGPTTTLVVTEFSDDTSRRFTELAVNEVIAELKWVVESQFALNRDGYLPEPTQFHFPRKLPTPSPASDSVKFNNLPKLWAVEAWPKRGSGQELSVYCSQQRSMLPAAYAPACDEGIYQLLALIDVEQSGVVFVRVRRVDTGQLLSESKFTASSPEFIGFTAGGKRQFAYVAVLKLLDFHRQNYNQLSFEIWYQRSGVGAPMRLVRELVDLPKKAALTTSE